MVDMRRALAAALSAFVTMVVVAACGDDPQAALRAAIAEGCSLNSDCSSPLVCAFQTCHVECKSTRDCVAYGGGLCVQSDKPYYICQNPLEKNCARNSDCAGKQICGTDLHCRDQCVSDRDCLAGQSCTASVCAEPEELIGGLLPVSKTDTVGGNSCLHHSDCPGDLMCLFQVCTLECVADKDCRNGRTCQGTRCVAPGTALGVGGAAGGGGSGGATAGAAGSAAAGAASR